MYLFKFLKVIIFNFIYFFLLFYFILFYFVILFLFLNLILIHKKLKIQIKRLWIGLLRFDKLEEDLEFGDVVVIVGETLARLTCLYLQASVHQVVRSTKSEIRSCPFQVKN